MNKWITAMVSFVGVITLACGIGLRGKGSTAVSVIGGADGPTSVFIAGKTGTNSAWYLIITGIILLVAATFVWFFSKKR